MASTIKGIRAKVLKQLAALERLVPEHWEEYAINIRERIERAAKEDDLKSMRAIKREISIRTKDLTQDSVFRIIKEVVSLVEDLTGLKLMEEGEAE